MFLENFSALLEWGTALARGVRDFFDFRLVFSWFSRFLSLRANITVGRESETSRTSSYSTL